MGTNGTDNTEPWLRKAQTIFLGLDNGRTDEEGLTSFKIAKKLVVANGARFSSIFISMNKDYADEFARLDDEIKLLKTAFELWKKKIDEQKAAVHKMSQQQWKLIEESNDLEQKAYSVCSAYFHQVGRQPPPPPVLKQQVTLQTERTTNKKKPSPNIKKPKTSKLFSDVQKLLVELDSPHPDVAERAYKNLRARLDSEDLLIADVIILKPKGNIKYPENIEDALFNHIISATRMNGELEELKETYNQLQKQINFTDATIYNLEGTIEGAKQDIRVWTRKLQEEQKKTATSSATTVGSRPQPPPQPASPPQQPTYTFTSTLQPQPQSRTAQTVTPAPSPTPQPATSTVKPAATSQISSSPKRIPTPIKMVALSCAIILSWGYAFTTIPSWKRSFSKSAEEISKPVAHKQTPVRDPEPIKERKIDYTDFLQSIKTQPSPPSGTQHVPLPPKTHEQPFYIARDQVSFWKEIVKDKGSQKIGTLSFGDQVQVELPVGQNTINKTDKWVSIKDSNNRQGYVLRKQLSAKVPVRESIELPPVPDRTWPQKATERPRGQLKTTEQTSYEKPDSTEPYKKQAVKAYVCAGTGTITGVRDKESIIACTAFYSVNNGQDTKLRLCSYKKGGAPYALVYSSEYKWEEIYVPYESMSLERVSCTQTKTIKGNYAEPR